MGLIRSMCIILPNFSQMLEPLLRYRDLSVFKLVAIRHFGF